MRQAIARGRIISIHDNNVGPHKFQINYLDLYLGNGTSITLFGPSAASIDSILSE